LGGIVPIQGGVPDVADIPDIRPQFTAGSYAFFVVRHHLKVYLLMLQKALAHRHHWLLNFSMLQNQFYCGHHSFLIFLMLQIWLISCHHYPKNMNGWLNLREKPVSNLNTTYKSATSTKFNMAPKNRTHPYTDTDSMI